MQTRTIKVDYNRPRGYDVGYAGEHNETSLVMPVPAELEGADAYRVYFESTVGEYLQTELLTPVNGYVTVKITSDIIPEPGNMAAQLVAFVGAEVIGKSAVIDLAVKGSVPDEVEDEVDNAGIIAEITENTKARHTHTNKDVLDKLGETDGKPTYDGKALGGGSTGSELFIVNVQAQSGADEFTITSHDKTYAQIDEAYKAGKQILAVFTIDEDTAYLLPLVFAGQSNYTFGVFAGTVFIIGVGNTDSWHCSIAALDADSIEARPSADASSPLEPLQDILDYIVYPAVDKSHEHTNKAVIDKLSVSNGKLQYDGSDVGLKGDKGDPGANGKTPIKGTDYWTASDKQEIIDDIQPVFYIDLAGDYPDYTCPVVMADIKAAYEAGRTLECRCKMGFYTATLPLFLPMPNADTWLFSGSGALSKMGFSAQTFTVAISPTGVSAEDVRLATGSDIPGALVNPYPLTIKIGDSSVEYDGSLSKSIDIPTTKKISEGSNIALADNTEYRLTDVSTLTLAYPTGIVDFECWMRLTFVASGNITVTLPVDTGYIGTAPDFHNGETWELSFKDKILAAQKVGEGT